jgi:hypothetical protein
MREASNDKTGAFMASQATPTPLIPLQPATGAPSSATSIATDHSLFELDSELDLLLDQIQDEIEEQGEASGEAMERFQLFCQAMDVKIDRIGRFLRAWRHVPNTARRSRQDTPLVPRGRRTRSNEPNPWSFTPLPATISKG